MTITAPAPVHNDPLVGRNRVVVGMDDDPVSVAALRFAATEAAYRGGDVLAVQVWHYPYTYDFPTIWPEASNLGPTILVELQQTVNTVMAERAAAGEPAVPISVKVIEGDAAVALSEAAQGTALLVLGARHHNRLLGSVSQMCTSHPPCPVVVVPAAGRPA